MRSVRGAALVMAAGACSVLFGSTAQAQPICPGSGLYNQASCGEDVCSCASPCVQNEDCNSGCCVEALPHQRYCAVACACTDAGTLDPAVTVQLNCTPAPEVPAACSAASAGPFLFALAVFGGAAFRGHRARH